MSAPTYELVDKGDQWACVRDGSHVFNTYDRDADLNHPSYGLFALMNVVVEARWGRTPSWVRTDTGWRAA